MGSDEAGGCLGGTRSWGCSAGAPGAAVGSAHDPCCPHLIFRLGWAGLSSSLLLAVAKAGSAPGCLGLEGGAQIAACPQDVPEQRSMEYPKLYEPGQLNLLFNKREFFICIAQGIYTSVLMFFIPYGVFADATRDDGAQLADYQSFAVTVATSLVIVVSVQVGRES